jgi:hypothetical protein
MLNESNAIQGSKPEHKRQTHHDHFLQQSSSANPPLTSKPPAHSTDHPNAAAADPAAWAAYSHTHQVRQDISPPTGPQNYNSVPLAGGPVGAAAVAIPEAVTPYFRRRLQKRNDGVKADKAGAAGRRSEEVVTSSVAGIAVAGGTSVVEEALREAIGGRMMMGGIVVGCRLRWPAGGRMFRLRCWLVDQVCTVAEAAMRIVLVLRSSCCTMVSLADSFYSGLRSTGSAMDPCSCDPLVPSSALAPSPQDRLCCYRLFSMPRYRLAIARLHFVDC